MTLRVAGIWVVGLAGGLGSRRTPPLVMTFFLVFATGAKAAGEDDYAAPTTQPEYAARTLMFLPAAEEGGPCPESPHPQG